MRTPVDIYAERRALRSAMATVEAAITPRALEDDWGVTSRADELRDVLGYMQEADAGILGEGTDDHDLLESIRDRLLDVVLSCDVDESLARRRSVRFHTRRHPAWWRVRFAAETAARRLALVVGEERLIDPAYVAEYNIGPVESDRIMTEYLAARGAPLKERDA